MSMQLQSSTYGSIDLLHGWPGGISVQPLPLATTGWITKNFGSILFQEITTGHCVMRYYIFRFLEEMRLLIDENNKGLQSLLSLKGTIRHSIKGQKIQTIQEGQFTLLNAGKLETETIVPAGKECHLLNTYYKEQSYEDLLLLFPQLKRDLKKSIERPRFFLSIPRPVRHTVLDVTHEIFFETYQPELQKYYWELKLKQALFTQLAQTYTEAHGRVSTPLEREMAEKAKNIIEADIKQHYSNEELAAKVGWSESSLKRAFRQEYRLGMYEYLRRLRMQKAKELLLMDEQVKTVAPAVGMRPSNFTMEFQKYFGYRATSLRKGYK